MRIHRGVVLLILIAGGALSGCKGAMEHAKKDTLESQKPAGAAPAAAQASPTLPAGFESYDDPQGTGHLIYRNTHGGRAFARPNMREFLYAMRGYFGGAIRVTAATSDSQDTVVHALFVAKVAGKPVQGLAVVVMSQEGSTAGLIYDDANGLRSSYGRLSSYFGTQVLPGQNAQAVPEGMHLAASHTGLAYERLSEVWEQVIRKAPETRAESPLVSAGTVLRACQKQGVSCREVPEDDLVPKD